MKVQATTLMLLLMLLVGLGQASEYESFPAEYRIAGSLLVDGEHKPQNTHIYFRIQGQAAKDLYTTILGEPIENPCLDDGTLTKSSGNIQCNHNESSQQYDCYFGLGIQDNKTVPGAVC